MGKAQSKHSADGAINTTSANAPAAVTALEETIEIHPVADAALGKSKKEKTSKKWLFSGVSFGKKFHKAKNSFATGSHVETTSVDGKPQRLSAVDERVTQSEEAGEVVATKVNTTAATVGIMSNASPTIKRTVNETETERLFVPSGEPTDASGAIMTVGTDATEADVSNVVTAAEDSEIPPLSTGEFETPSTEVDIATQTSAEWLKITEFERGESRDANVKALMDQLNQTLQNEIPLRAEEDVASQRELSAIEEVVDQLAENVSSMLDSADGTAFGEEVRSKISSINFKEFSIAQRKLFLELIIEERETENLLTKEAKEMLADLESDNAATTSDGIEGIYSVLVKDLNQNAPKFLAEYFMTNIIKIIEKVEQEGKGNEG